ncbi:MAG: nicotinamide-nucleotide adenylyltransferase [Halodesulfurarchaeum sp.]
MTRGFYIGRFQPYHQGHQQVIEQITAEVDELVVGIGSADQSHTPENPFTAGERMVMITKCLADIDVVTYVVPIEDINRNSVWVSHVEAMSPAFDVAYSNNPLVIRLFEESGIEVRGSPMFDRDVLEGTTIRERMREDEGWRELLPEPALETIEEINGIGRIQHITDGDGSGRADPE